MFSCKKCNKEFEFESKLNEHKNRKTECNKNITFNCDICKSYFKYKSDYLRHEKTKKHIINVNKIIVNTHNKKIPLDENNNLNLKINELENKIIKLENENITKIIELENIIRKLENENQYLKNNNKIHNDNEYIYIIHPAQCININIYKIGRTKNIINRFKQYPKRF
jgi:hypothetical protein